MKIYIFNQKSDDYFTKLFKRTFKSACNFYSGYEKDRCDALIKSLSGVYVSDTVNIGKKIKQIQKKTDFLFINGQTTILKYDFHDIGSKIIVDIDSTYQQSSSSISLIYIIQKSIRKTIHNMIKVKFDGSPSSLKKLKLASNNNIYKQSSEDNLPKSDQNYDIKVKRHNGSHMNGNGMKTSTIIGILIGCIIAIIIIIVIICYCVKKKKQDVNNINQENSKSDNNQNNGYQEQQNYYQYQQPQYTQLPQYNQQPPMYNQQQPQYPQQPNYPSQPYVPPAGVPSQPYQNYQNQTYLYPNQGYQGQASPYQTNQYQQAIPIQPYESVNYNQYQGHNLSDLDSDSIDK